MIPTVRIRYFQQGHTQGGNDKQAVRYDPGAIDTRLYMLYNIICDDFVYDMADISQHVIARHWLVASN